jgi:hypothetical protein
MLRTTRLLAATTVVACVLVLGAPAAAAPSPPTYEPPVDAPVSDPFRAPADRYASGNRGIEYATTGGAPVVAASDGIVSFAGVVARQLWVTISHPDGLRTTVGPLAEALVAAGQPVAQGDLLGRAAGPLLFTVRRGDDYIDPASVVAAAPRVHLVADGAPPPRRLGPPTQVGLGTDLVAGLVAWWRQRDEPCTPTGVRPEPRREPRVAVLVGGLGSSSHEAAIDAVDLAGLGYLPGASVRFSYAGGRIPGHPSPALAAIHATPYLAADSLGDLDVAAKRLAELLVAVVDASPPSVPIDVLAHSQGGLVARFGLAHLEEERPDVLARLGVVVTFGSPHHGAPIAGVISALAANRVDAAALDAMRRLAGTDIEPGSVAVRELAPGSATINRLDRLRPPKGVRLLSIAARADMVVPPSRTRVTGATNVVVGVPGLDDHALLPGAPAAEREVALALAGMPPTCTTLRGGLLTRLVSELVDAAEGLVGG